MSWQYGWNAQSALLPEKSIQIKVGNKGLQKMKSTMEMLKQKNKDKLSKGKMLSFQTIKVTNQVKRNKGIEERVKRDEQQRDLKDENDNKSLGLIQRQLQKKEKMYDQIQKNPRNHSKFLVDFVQKQLSKQDQQIEQLKREFYSGKLKQVLEQQERIHDDQKGVHGYMRENLSWEKQVLQELNGQVRSEKLKVAQSFDRKFTEQQKSALQKVIEERLKQKKRVVLIRERQEEEEIQKLKKLRKLDILSDDD